MTILPDTPRPVAQAFLLMEKEVRNDGLRSCTRCINFFPPLADHLLVVSLGFLHEADPSLYDTILEWADRVYEHVKQPYGRLIGVLDFQTGLADTDEVLACRFASMLAAWTPCCYTGAHAALCTHA